jgi:hypothetical protein
VLRLAVPRDLDQPIRNGDESAIRFLFADLDLAFTFLETARVSEDHPETKQRNVANAVKAYHSVSHIATMVYMSPDTHQYLQARLNALAGRLLDFGQTV